MCALGRPVLEQPVDRLHVHTRKGALEYIAFTCKQAVENARQTLQFYSEACNVYIYTNIKSLLFYPVDYVSPTGRRLTASYEMKTNATWIYSASHFASVEGALHPSAVQ